jgi:ribosomal protein L3 glutamine methyltransferase
MTALSSETVESMIDWAAGELAAHPLHYGHGTDNPDDEAAWLVRAGLGDSPVAPSLAPNQVLDPDQEKAVRQLVRRRISSRLPTAYLTGRTWFAGLEVQVDQRVLIPRSPLAELIQDGFRPWLDPAVVSRILDLCTGSGCIALACAHYFPDALVDASDLDPDALAVAAGNLSFHGLEKRMRLIRSDLFDQLGDSIYDVILSNPPYVGRDEWQALPQEYHHEPRLALEADDQGLALVDRILLCSGRHLSANGVLFLEVGNSADLMQQSYPALKMYWLEFARGGAGVCAIYAADLRAWLRNTT